MQRRGTLTLMLDSGKKADSIGTHGRWREVPLVQILKEEWDFPGNDEERASGQRKECEQRDADPKTQGCLEKGVSCLG